MPFAQRELPSYNHMKTYKRETAGMMLFILFVFFAWGVFEPRALDVGKHLTIPVFLFASGAFGLDAMAKQLR